MRVAGQHPEGVAHHGGARHLAEGADMRQARGAVAGLEQHLVLAGALEPRDELARLLERPGGGGLRGLGKGGSMEKRRLIGAGRALGAVDRCGKAAHPRERPKRVNARTRLRYGLTGKKRR